MEFTLLSLANVLGSFRGKDCLAHGGRVSWFSLFAERVSHTRKAENANCPLAQKTQVTALERCEH